VIAGLEDAEYSAHAAEAISDFLRSRGADDVRTLLVALDGAVGINSSDEILRHAAVTFSVDGVRLLINDLDSVDMYSRASTVLSGAAVNRPPSDVAELLAMLPSNPQHTQMINSALQRVAQERAVPDLAALIVNLETHRLLGYIDVLWRYSVSDQRRGQLLLQEAVENELRKRRNRRSRPSSEGPSAARQVEQEITTFPNLRVEQGAWRRFWVLVTPGRPRKRDLVKEMRNLRGVYGEACTELEALRIQLEMEIIRREAIEARVSTYVSPPFSPVSQPAGRPAESQESGLYSG
jgi:hypothetical protein